MTDPMVRSGFVAERPFTIYCAAAIGAFFLSVGDLLKNDHAATTVKIGEMLKQHILPGLEAAVLLALVFIVACGCLVCWLYQPQSRIDAFARGFSIFAIMAVAAPYEPVTSGLSVSASTTTTSRYAILLPLRLIRTAVADIRQRPDLETISIVVKDQDGNDLAVPQVITIRDVNSYEILGREKILSSRFKITRPAGEYRLEIEAPGYQRSTTNIRIAAPENEYEIKLERTHIPLPFQRLYAPQQVNPR